MVNYNNTKIYYIPVGDSERYYGHTTQPLCQRKGGHKSDFIRNPNIKLYKTMRDAGMTENDIELVWVEDFPCERKEQALARERYYVEQYATLNTRLPTRTYKEWYAENAEKLREQYAKYRAENADKVRERVSTRIKCPHCEKELRRDFISRHIKKQHPS